jgi:phosphoenolpyruvate carboxykinase (GTP)
MGRKIQHPPRIFRVNWFRRDANGKFLWPGFGENMRVLQWIAQRCQGRAAGVETALGLMPRFEDLIWRGLEDKMSAARFSELARVDAAAWKEELASHDELFGRFGERLPEALEARRGRMHEKLAA